MSAVSTTKRNATETRALELLGSGLSPEMVANTCGVSVSRISQLLSDADFAEEVSQIRFSRVQKHNARDAGYDELEDKLLEQFKGVMPLMMRPMEVMKAMATVNALKRRGQSAPEAIGQSKEVVTIVMPTQIINHFTTNINNQVIKAGSQELVTIQSSIMDTLSKKSAGTSATLENGVSDENGQKRIGSNGSS